MLNFRRNLHVAQLHLLLIAAFICTDSTWEQQQQQPAVNVELHVAAAADMQPVLETIGPIFEKRSGIKLRISYASSATLAEQILSGAPQDIFLSASYTFAERVVAGGLAENNSPTPYAKGVLVLWTRKDTPYNPLHLEALEDKSLKSVAIANPDHAPYGSAAIVALKKLNYYPNVVPHIVLAESIAQAAQFTQSGNAQLGLISQTIALSPKFRDSGSFVLIPTYAYPEIRQCAVILRNAHQAQAAHKLLDFILSDEVQTALPKLGLNRIQ